MWEDVPGLRTLREFGGDDPVFDAFILAGPVVVAALAVGGRNTVTTALAAGYVASFCLYVVSKWARA